MLADKQGDKRQMIITQTESKKLAEAFCEDSPNDHVYLQNGKYYILADTPQGLCLVDAFSTEIYDEHFECREN